MPDTTTRQAGAITGLLARTGKPMSLGDATIRATQAAPGLKPATALTVAQKGGTVTQNAQVVTHAHKQIARARAAEEATRSTGGGLFGFISTATHYLGDVATPVMKDIGDVAHDVGDVVPQSVGHYLSDAGKALNAPLRQVQHEYRYLRDVEARHGQSAAIMEGIGMAAGAAIGTLIELGEGTVLGAEAAGYLEGQVSYKSSWARTATGARYKTPTTGDVISIGRTVARLLGMNPDTRNYSTLSGVVDGISDLILTPLGQAGKVVGAARSASGAQGLVGKIWGGIGLQSPEDIDRAYNSYRSVRNAFGWIADHDAATIITRYGAKIAPIAEDLGRASTPEEVKDILQDTVRANEIRTTDGLISSSETAFRRRAQQYLAASSELPTSTLASEAAFGVKTAAGNAPRIPLLERLVGPASWSRRFTTVPGGYVDETTGKLETELNFNSGRGAATILHMMRYADSTRAARYVAESYVYADPADRIKIFKNAVMAVINAMAFKESALPEDLTADVDMDQIADPTTRAALKKYMDHLDPEFGAGGEYGKNAAGMEQGTLHDPENDITRNYAVLRSQAGKGVVPSFTEVKRMGAMLRGSKDLLGRIDTWTFDRVTTAFFKRWVLQTPSYALHMAAAEDVLNTLRLGARNMVKGAAYAAASKLAYPIDEDTAKGFALWLHRLGRLSDYAVAPLARDQERLEWDARLYVTTENHGTVEAIAASHGGSSFLDGDAVRATRVTRRLAQNGVALQRGAGFTSYSADSPFYMDAWQDAAREMARNEEGRVAAQAYRDAREAGLSEEDALYQAGQHVTDYLRNTVPEEELALYPASRLFKPGDHPAGWDPIDTWGDRIAQSMHGLMSRDPDDLSVAQAIAEGRAPTMGELAAIDPSLRPSLVKGRVIEPVAQSTPAKVAAWGFKRILSPIIDRLSRDPLFEAEYWKALKEGGLIDQVERGELSEDEAVQQAATRAANKAIKFVHNVHTRTQWSETVRNWFPFAFAQEQAYKRAGRLLLTDPGAFRRYQLMIQGVANFVAQQTSPTGTKLFTMPGSGLLGKGVPALLAHLGMPLSSVTASMAGEFTSANVIFPLSTGFRPDLSPLASLAAKALVAKFPETLPYVTRAVGSQTLEAPLWEQVVPNVFAQRAVQTALATKYRSFADSMMQTIQQLDYEQNEAVQRWIKDGRQGPYPDFIPRANATPHEMQEFVNKVRNQTRVLFGMRALLGFVSPISPEVSIQTWGLRKDLTEEIKKQGSVAKGYTVFLKKHPDATPYTVSESYATTSGMPTGVRLTESTQAMDWYNAHKTEIDAHPFGAAWLMPQPATRKYSYQIYNEQLADHMRTKYAPKTFLDQLYIAAGTNAYYAADARFRSELAQVPKDSAQYEQLYQEWTAYKRSLAAASPIWAAYWNSNARQSNAQRSIDTLRQMLKEGLFPDNPQANAVKQLLANYETAERQYIAANSGWDYAKAQSEVKQAWYAYLTEIKKMFPRLEPVVESVFEGALGTTNVTPEGIA